MGVRVLQALLRDLEGSPAVRDVVNLGERLPGCYGLLPLEPFADAARFKGELGNRGRKRDGLAGDEAAHEAGGCLSDCPG